MARISVIIPVYNAEEYLDKCLGSVLGQTFEDFEIIAVNDGSTDSSLEILLDYAKRYGEKIKVITQEKRRPVGRKKPRFRRSHRRVYLFCGQR